jgi:hypothetical protein
MYLVYTKNTIENTEKFQLVHYSHTEYIFVEDKIPEYVKYFMFNSCPNNKEINTNFNNYRNDTIGLNIRKNQLESNLETYKKKSIELKRRILIEQLNPSEESGVKLDKLKEELKFTETDITELEKILQEMKNNISKGGSIPNQYYPPQQYPIQNYNYPRQNYPPQNYPIQNYNYPYIPYNPSYNMVQNKEKVQKSKLSFYITIELDLFPGTSVNMSQKHMVKCQSTFERVREAWTDIFGFQYKKAPMIEAYSYQNNKKDKTQKNTKYNNNKTQKNTKYQKK